MKSKYKVYASVYKIPELGNVKAHLIIIVDYNGKLVETLPGPVNIGPLVQRFTQKYAKEVVQSAVEDWFHIEVGLDDIEFMPYDKLGKLLFKLQNK
jgi:hypothetical protein